VAGNGWIHNNLGNPYVNENSANYYYTNFINIKYCYAIEYHPLYIAADSFSIISLYDKNYEFILSVSDAIEINYTSTISKPTYIDATHKINMTAFPEACYARFSFYSNNVDEKYLKVYKINIVNILASQISKYCKSPISIYNLGKWSRGRINNNGIITNTDRSALYTPSYTKVLSGTKIIYTGNKAGIPNYNIDEDDLFVAWVIIYDKNLDYKKRVVLHSSNSDEYDGTYICEDDYNIRFMISTRSSGGNVIYIGNTIRWSSLFSVEFEQPISGNTQEVALSNQIMALKWDTAQNSGVQNAILTAYQYTDCKWVPVADMPGIKSINGVYEYVPFYYGCRQKGIPYSRRQTSDMQVGMEINFDTFITAAMNPNSVLYTNNDYNASTKTATHYGIVCSKMVQACWGYPLIYPSQKIYDMPGVTLIANAGNFDENDIQLADGLIAPDIHSTIITGILRDYNNNVKAIEVSEAITPVCIRRVYTINEFFDRFAEYNLYRYDNINNAKYNKAKYIDLDDGYEGYKDIPIGIRAGSYINFKKNTSHIADIDNSKWRKVHYIVDGNDTEINISSNELSLDTSKVGYIEAYPEDANGNKGNSSYYYVYNYTENHTVSGNSITINFTVTEGSIPWYLQWTSAVNYPIIIMDASSNSITATIPNNTTKFRLSFKTDYGVWHTSFINI